MVTDALGHYHTFLDGPEDNELCMDPSCGWRAKYEHFKTMYDRLYQMRMPLLDTICFMEKWCQEMRAMHGGDDIHADVDPNTSKLHSVESHLGPPQDKDKGDVYQPAAASALTYLHTESCTTPLRRSPWRIGQKGTTFQFHIINFITTCISSHIKQAGAPHEEW